MQKYREIKYKYCYRAKILGDIMIDYDDTRTLFSPTIPDGFSPSVDETVMPIRSKSVVIPSMRGIIGISAAPRDLDEGKKKEATRGIPLSHYGMPDQKCSYFIDLFWRAAREPLRWPSLARVHEEKLRSR